MEEVKRIADRKRNIVTDKNRIGPERGAGEPVPGTVQHSPMNGEGLNRC
jgi:hypothetical protein